MQEGRGGYNESRCTLRSIYSLHLPTCLLIMRRAHVKNSTDGSRVQIVFCKSKRNGCILVNVLDAHVLIVPEALADGLGICFNFMLELRV